MQREELLAPSSAAVINSGCSHVVPSRKLRIALYSHDTMGIGHMRRNALIAGAIAGSPLSAAILLVCGAREACTFPLPLGTDCLTLPSYYKDADGYYRSRTLDVSVEQLVAVRAQTIAAALGSFEPDVVIVDKVPRGALGELEPALKLLQAEGHTRCILGLRDILDEPDKVRRDWGDGANVDAILDYYDAVWIYGDPVVYDQVREYEYPASVAAKMRYTGYLTRPLRTDFLEIDDAEFSPFAVGPRGRIFLCMVGGGQDGYALTEAFAQVDFPPGTTGVIVTGPFVPPDVHHRVRCLAAGKPQLRVLKFVANPDLLLSLADRVVAMGGYNTICEVLSLGKRALIVPRIKPRREQWIRAERLQNMGLLDVLHPDAVNPRTLTEWLTCDHEPLVRVRDRINFNGAENVPRFLEELLAEPLRYAQTADSKT